MSAIRKMSRLNQYHTGLKHYFDFCLRRLELSTKLNLTTNVPPFRMVGTFKNFWYRRKHNIVQPCSVSQSRVVPKYIPLPEYALNGSVSQTQDCIDLKSIEEQQHMRESCRLAKMILEETGKQVEVGVQTDELDEFVHNLCIKHKCYPSPLNYKSFPKSVCTSVNNVAVHGIPDSRALQDGDIISIDVSVFYQGYHGDCAASFAVGTVDNEGKKLMKAAQKCLENAISICRPEEPFNSIGRMISETCVELGFNVMPVFCGHGIGKYFHGPPEIIHCENDYPGVMKEGMVFTIEPVITEGDADYEVLEDGWTAVTSDNSRAAQYEHTILITQSGNEIFTLDKFPS